MAFLIRSITIVAVAVILGTAADDSMVTKQQQQNEVDSVVATTLATMSSEAGSDSHSDGSALTTAAGSTLISDDVPSANVSRVQANNASETGSVVAEDSSSGSSLDQHSNSSQEETDSGSVAVSEPTSLNASNDVPNTAVQDSPSVLPTAAPLSNSSEARETNESLAEHHHHEHALPTLLTAQTPLVLGASNSTLEKTGTHATETELLDGGGSTTRAPAERDVNATSANTTMLPEGGDNTSTPTSNSAADALAHNPTNEVVVDQHESEGETNSSVEVATGGDGQAPFTRVETQSPDPTTTAALPSTLASSPSAAIAVTLHSSTNEQVTMNPNSPFGARSTTIATPPPVPLLTTSAPAIQQSAAPPTELEVRLKKFCRHTRSWSELRHPIVFGQGLSPSEFIVMCKGFKKSPHLLPKLPKSMGTHLSAAACAALSATDVERLDSHVFGALSAECVSSISGASWRGVRPMHVVELFRTAQGRHAFHLAKNVSGLPLISIVEVERQSGCFSTEQCSSLQYRSRDHQPKVCRTASDGERGVPLVTSSPMEPIGSRDPRARASDAHGPRATTVDVEVAGSSKKDRVPHTVVQQRSATEPTSERLRNGGGSSFVLPVAAGAITAFVLFMWFQIRKQSSC